jgi:hypothetical protein
MEESYKKGYRKGCEDTKKQMEANRKRGKWVMKNDICFCPQCLVCGSPQWKVCPVCEIKMEGVVEC